MRNRPELRPVSDVNIDEYRWDCGSTSALQSSRWTRELSFDRHQPRRLETAINALERMTISSRPRRGRKLGGHLSPEARRRIALAAKKRSAERKKPKKSA